MSEKVDTKVSFPLAINMLPYTTRPWSQEKSDFDYDLLSVVVHLGDIDSGHYLAYCRQGENVISPPSSPNRSVPISRSPNANTFRIS